MGVLFAQPIFAQEVRCQNELLNKIVKNNEFGVDLNHLAADTVKSDDGKIITLSNSSAKLTIQRETEKSDFIIVNLKNKEILGKSVIFCSPSNEMYRSQNVGNLKVEYDLKCQPKKAEFCHKVDSVDVCTKADLFSCGSLTSARQGLPIISTPSTNDNFEKPVTGKTLNPQNLKPCGEVIQDALCKMFAGFTIKNDFRSLKEKIKKNQVNQY